MIAMKRREFLGACCVGAAAAGAPRFLLAGPSGAEPHDTLVYVFLRGGIDGLNLVVPINGNDRSYYEEARPDLSIAATGTYGALPLTLANSTQTGFGFHPSAVGLRDIWTAGKLAIVRSAGLMPTITRSHFDAQLYIELGTPGQQGIGSGWLTRHAASDPTRPQGIPVPALAIGSGTPTSLLAETAALTTQSPDDFALNSGAWSWQTSDHYDPVPAGFQGLNERVAELWQGSSTLEQSGLRADNALRIIADQNFVAMPGSYPSSGFANQLWDIAQMIRFGVGVRVATVDVGGWDTHDSQGTAGSGYHYYQNKIAEISAALYAFFADLTNSGHMGRVTVVVQSEFGRRVRQNGDGGTDHGYGNNILVLGGPVNGRQMYGQWLGLEPAVLSPYFGDIPVTVDYRRVLSEILIRRFGNNRLGSVFPGYSGYAPLNIVQGADMPPDYSGDSIFADTFE
jgi:uncharacterized protein (DUF1501 family)